MKNYEEDVFNLLQTMDERVDSCRLGNYLELIKLAEDFLAFRKAARVEIREDFNLILPPNKKVYQNKLNLLLVNKASHCRFICGKFIKY